MAPFLWELDGAGGGVGKRCHQLSPQQQQERHTKAMLVLPGDQEPGPSRSSPICLPGHFACVLGDQSPQRSC